MSELINLNKESFEKVEKKALIVVELKKPLTSFSLILDLLVFVNVDCDIFRAIPWTSINILCLAAV